MNCKQLIPHKWYIAKNSTDRRDYWWIDTALPDKEYIQYIYGTPFFLLKIQEEERSIETYRLKILYNNKIYFFDVDTKSFKFEEVK